MAKLQPHTLPATALVVLVLLVPIAVGAGIVYFIYNQPETAVRQVLVQAIAPAQVEEGEIFELKVIVQNNTDQAVNLHGLDLAVSYFDGFVLFATTPEYLTQDDGHLFRGFEFDQPIEPGTNTQVLFRLQAVNAGEWSGDIDARVSGTAGTLTTKVKTLAIVPRDRIGAPPDDGPPMSIEPDPE
ncbi:MAG: hypothetical protein ACIAXF_02400 [Phycisphaerales bacterium JB063]